MNRDLLNSLTDGNAVSYNAMRVNNAMPNNMPNAGMRNMPPPQNNNRALTGNASAMQNNNGSRNLPAYSTPAGGNTLAGQSNNVAAMGAATGGQALANGVKCCCTPPLRAYPGLPGTTNQPLAGGS